MRTSFHGYSVRLMKQYNLTAKHIIYLDWFLRWRGTEKMLKKGDTHWVNHGKAVEDIGPIVGHTSRNAARRAFKKLEDAGLLYSHKSDDNRIYYGVNGSQLERWRMTHEESHDTPSNANGAPSTPTENPSTPTEKGQSYDVHKTSNSCTTYSEKPDDEEEKSDKQSHTPHQEIVEYWNEEIAEPNDLSKRLKPGALKPNIRKKWKEFAEHDEDGDPWKTYELIKKLIESCAFLRGDAGQGDGNWSGADFIFIFKRRDSWQKILTGYYHDRGGPTEKAKAKKLIKGEEYDPWKDGNFV